MRRQKRKPDSIQLNFVQSNAKRRSISVQKVRYPIAQLSQEEFESRPSTVSTTSASTSTTASTDATRLGFDLPDLDCYQSSPTSSKQHTHTHTERQKQLKHGMR